MLVPDSTNRIKRFESTSLPGRRSSGWPEQQLPAKTRTFSTRLAGVPQQPGVYIHRDADGGVLYIGKSASLRNRLRSYFGSKKNLDAKTFDLVSRIHDFEYIVTESEQEALLLENSLIKEHKPKYNIRLKDDKTYPYIKVDLAEDFPRVYVTRRTANDGARYFGPFASAGSVRKTLDLLKRLFPYRSCTKVITGTDDRPCLEPHQALRSSLHRIRLENRLFTGHRPGRAVPRRQYP